VLGVLSQGRKAKSLDRRGGSDAKMTSTTTAETIAREKGRKKGFARTRRKSKKRVISLSSSRMGGQKRLEKKWEILLSMSQPPGQRKGEEENRVQKL